MNNRLIRRFLSGLALVSAVAAVHAADQESVTFTGVPMIATSNGGPTNYSWTPTVGGYALGRIRFTGNLTQVAAGDYMSENRFTVTTGGGAVSATTAVSGTTTYSGTQRPHTRAPSPFQGRSSSEPARSSAPRWPGTSRSSTASVMPRPERASPTRRSTSHTRSKTWCRRRGKTSGPSPTE